MRIKNRPSVILHILGIIIFMGFTGVAAPQIYAQSSGDIHVNPIDNLSPDFIMGADVSMLKQIEDSGGKFYDKGVEKDALTILKEHGVHWIRLRIWNDPTDEAGNYLGGGNNDLKTT